MSRAFRTSFGGAYATWETRPRASGRSPKRSSERPTAPPCVEAIDAESYPGINQILRDYEHHHEPKWKSPPSPPASTMDQDRSRWMRRIEELVKAGSLDDAKEIDLIREQVDEVSVAAESYLRAMIKGLPAVLRVEQAPSWLDEPTDDYDPASIDPRVMISAKDILRSVLAAAPVEVSARCERSRDGGLEISWDVPRQLTWVISKPRLPWPGVNVRAYARAHEDQPALDVRTFLLAHRLIDHAVPILRHER